MADNLREAYKTKVATESSNLTSKIKAFQKYFQVLIDNMHGLKKNTCTVLKLMHKRLYLFSNFSVQKADGQPVFLKTKTDVRLYRYGGP